MQWTAKICLGYREIFPRPRLFANVPGVGYNRNVGRDVRAVRLMGRGTIATGRIP
jgi:hypothetical protein